MLRNRKIMVNALIALIAVLVFVSFVAPVALAGNGSGNGTIGSGGGADASFICEGGLNQLLSSIMTLVVVAGGLVAVFGGAGYTLASAAKPSKDEYTKGRNYSMLYGGGTVVVLYLANAVIGQLTGGALSYGCILPLTG